MRIAPGANRSGAAAREAAEIEETPADWTGARKPASPLLGAGRTAPKKGGRREPYSAIHTSPAPVPVSRRKRRAERFLRRAGTRLTITFFPLRPGFPRIRAARNGCLETMKISGSPPSAPTRGVREPSKAKAAESAAAPAAAEASFFRGVPDAELTPRVRTALISLIEEVTSLRAELAETQARMQELEQLAETDPLLGIANRRAFVRELNRALALVERYGVPASLVFADLNNLKTINDGLGHAAGDAALAHVASVIAGNIRQSDTLSRLGGDEFGIILLQANQATAAEKARSLAEAVAAEPVQWSDRIFNAEISYGAVEIRKGWSVDEALATADSAMYDAKRGPRT